MTLNITSALDLTGTDGRHGADGAPAIAFGQDGGNGRGGQSATLDVSNQVFTGDAGADSINIFRSATGGLGGSGGHGAAGFEGELTVVFSDGPGFSQVDFRYGPSGDGGAGGLGAAAARAACSSPH